MLEICLATLQLSLYCLTVHAGIDLPTPPCLMLLLSLMPFRLRCEMNLFCTVTPMYTATACGCYMKFKVAICRSISIL